MQATEVGLQRPQLMNGAEALATAFYLAGARVAYTYPITPQSEVMEHFSRYPDMMVIQADSEYNVLAGAEGVLWSGQRCAVATASQGLVLMSEVLWEVAGNRLPLVMGVFNRGLKTVGWCLGTQQNDSLSIRDTGWLQFYCGSAQELLDFVLIGYRLAEAVKLPTMVAGDGFYLSHEREEVWVPTPEEAARFVGPPNFGLLPRGDEPLAFGGVAPPHRYFEGLRRMHHDVQRAKALFEEIAQDYARRFGRLYRLVEPVFTEDAEWVFLTAGTIGGTAREVVEVLRAEGFPVGLIQLQAFRPFPTEALGEALHRRDGSFVPHLLVFDRNLAPGHGGIFAGEVRLALSLQRIPTQVHSFVTGLGGMDVTPEMLERAWHHVRHHPEPRETWFLAEEVME